MKQRWIAILIIAFLLVGFGTFEQVYFHRTIGVMHAQTESLLDAVKLTPEQIDSEENLAAAKKFVAYWNTHKHYYEMLLSHTYTLEVERNTSVLLNHLEQNDYLMTTTDLSALNENWNMLRESITPHLHTIL